MRQIDDYIPVEFWKEAKQFVEEVRDDVVAFSDTIRTQTYTAKLVRSLITHASAFRVILPHVNIPLDDIACIGVLLGDG